MKRPYVSRLTRPTAAMLLVTLAAVVMGLPTLRGGFVGGDDHRLLLNHVLVNHPSLAHAAELFTIYHRDLYQPLPLLSFQAEFAIADLFGLFDQGVEAATWLFHLTNILLHALNTVLVWILVRRLQIKSIGTPTTRPAGSPAPVEKETADSGARSVATIAAVLFAIHPLQMEVIAWTNGRMMLLSTLFAVASMIALSRWLDSRRLGVAALTVFLVILCGISKVRVGLPILLLIVAWACHAKITRGFGVVWLLCTTATGLFALINIQATAGAQLFSQGAEHLTGPRLVRIAMALAWYVEHLVWPSGLASYYPTPPHVGWTDALSLRVLGVLVAAGTLTAWACRQSRIARLGTLWFFATIASTLPLVPARNILAADRYMYLPIIGIFWFLATFAYNAYRRSTAGRPGLLASAIPIGAAAILVPPMIGTGWHVASFYETSLKKTSRIASLFPDTPRVWEKLGWCQYSEGEYERAIESAKLELRHDAVSVRAGATQLIGMAEFRLGNNENALQVLHRAVDMNPKSALAKFRVGLVYSEIGRTDEAIPWFEQAVEGAPQHNPTIIRLATAYRSVGRTIDARKMYERALDNNQHEVPAAMALAEMDIATGTQDSLNAALLRLRQLLEWTPENTEALTNLGATLVKLGREQEAIRAYDKALRVNPYHPIAALNLGQLHASNGDSRRARHLFERSIAGGLQELDRLAVIHDFFVSQGEPQRAAALWHGRLDAQPESAEGRAYFSWTLALSGNVEQAAEQARLLPTAGSGAPMGMAAKALIGLARGDYESSKSQIGALSATGTDGIGARRWVLSALEQFDQYRPGIPWTFCLAAQLLGTDGSLQLADVSIQFCEQRCVDDACRSYAEGLRSTLIRDAQP